MIDVDKVRNQWPMARVMSVNEDDQGLVRPVTVRTSSDSILHRPINKWILLVETSEEEQEKTGEFPDGEPKSLSFVRRKVKENNLSKYT